MAYSQPPRIDLAALAVLAILSEGQSHPYEITHQVRVRYQDELEGHTARSLYRAVDRLTDEGLIEVAELVREGRRPERTVYRITEEGRSHLRYQLTDLLSNPRLGPQAFQAAIARLGYLSEIEAVTALEVRLGALEGLVAHHRAAHRSLRERSRLPRLFLLEVEWRLHQMEAEIAFVTATVAAIRSRQLDVEEDWLRGLAQTGAALPDLTGVPPERVPLAVRASPSVAAGGDRSSEKRAPEES